MILQGNEPTSFIYLVLNQGQKMGKTQFKPPN